jgi:cytosine/adenosine deaminase-related metal-dependent hydrolase
VTAGESPGPILLTAAWVAPMNAKPFRGGAVVVDGGRIVAVGPASEVRRHGPFEQTHDFGDSVILPGLINAHTHLELSRVMRPDRPGRFIDWLSLVLGAGLDPGAAAAAVAEGAGESLRFGVTTVGDISRHVAAARAALRRSPLRAVSFGEVVGMARRKHVLPGLLADAVADSTPEPNVRPAVSPHAPYSIDADGYRRCLEAAREQGLALSTHLAESPDEARFLSDHAGPFRELWERLGAWDESSVPRFAGGPVRHAASLGLLGHHPTALAHVNYCDDAELALLAGGGASVVYCPRTHAYFGHPPHRWREMLGRGINVAVGTDSRASSPDLNPVDDLRLLYGLAPDVPALSLWEMVTVRAARAIGLENDVGSLSPGKLADVAVFPATGDDPLARVLETRVLPCAVWVGGTPQFTTPQSRWA